MPKNRNPLNKINFRHRVFLRNGMIYLKIFGSQRMQERKQKIITEAFDDKQRKMQIQLAVQGSIYFLISIRKLEDKIIIRIVLRYRKINN